MRCARGWRRRASCRSPPRGLERTDERGIGNVGLAEVEELDAAQQQQRLGEGRGQHAAGHPVGLAEQRCAEIGVCGNGWMEGGWGRRQVEPSMGLGDYGVVGTHGAGLCTSGSVRSGQRAAKSRRCHRGRCR